MYRIIKYQDRDMTNIDKRTKQYPHLEFSGSDLRDAG